MDEIYFYLYRLSVGCGVLAILFFFGLLFYWGIRLIARNSFVEKMVSVVLLLLVAYFIGFIAMQN